MAATVFGIANPTLMINGEIVNFVPNSLSARRGYGEVKTMPESAGGENVDNVITRDLTTATGHFTFKVRPTAANIEKILFAQDQPGQNLIQIVNALNANLNASMNGASIANDPDLNFGADSEIEVQMQGNQWVIQV